MQTIGIREKQLCYYNLFKSLGKEAKESKIENLKSDTLGHREDWDHYICTHIYWCKCCDKIVLECF